MVGTILKGDGGPTFLVEVGAGLSDCRSCLLIALRTGEELEKLTHGFLTSQQKTTLLYIKGNTNRTSRLLRKYNIMIIVNMQQKNNNILHRYNDHQITSPSKIWCI